MGDDLGIELDRLSAKPLWEQLADALRRQLLTGAIQPDRKLPGEFAMAEALSIGRATVARSVAILRDEGLIVWSPGRGIFSAPADQIARIKRASR